MFFEGKAYYFVGKEGWDEAANGATKKDLTDVKQWRLGAVTKQNSGVCLSKIGTNKANCCRHKDEFTWNCFHVFFDLQTWELAYSNRGN